MFGQQQTSFSPLSEKCFYWTNLLTTNVSSVGERANYFMDILDQIFSTNCLFTSSRMNETEFNSLRNFLSPNGGILFSTIDRFFKENNTKFDLPIHKLNSVSQQKLRSSDTSEFFRRIFDSTRGIIHTTAFEYFLYRFADNVHQRHAQDDASLFEGLLDCVYSVLLQDYLLHFLPIDRSLAPYLDESSAVNSSDFYNVSSNIQQRPIGLGLLKREIYEKTVVTSNEQTVAMTTPTSAFLAKSWTFLQILCDLYVTNAQSTRADGFLTMLIRSIIKHVHRFAWRTANVKDLGQQLNVFNENVVARLFAPRLLRFFDFNFAKWPLDASFRSLLELWLTFIQPWRYSDVDEHQDSMIVDERWEFFVEKHYIFYTKFLRLTFTRFIRTDLKAFKNAVSLCRVIRVFGQTNLIPMLKFITQARSRNSSAGGGYHGNSERDNFVDLEFRSILYQLATEIASAYAYCRSNLNRLNETAQNRSFTDRFVDFFSDTETETARLGGELTKTADYLDYSLATLGQLFDMPDLKTDVTMATNASSSVKRQLSTSSASSVGMTSSSFNDETGSVVKPDCLEDRNGYLKLTPLGRSQIMNKLCSAQNYSTPLDLAPPRFDEFAPLVKFWQFIDGAINRRYSMNIDRMYNRKDVFGRAASYVFCAPTRDFYKKSPVSSRARIDLPARLSLRYFARIKFCLMYILLTFIFWLVFSISPISTILFSILLLILFVVLIAYV